MKTLSLTLFLFISLISFSQKLIIHVFEREELVSLRKTTIDSVLSTPDISYGVDDTYVKYVIDFDNETSTYFVNGVESSELPIKCTDLGDGILMVNILELGFDYGLIINTNLSNESVLWFWFDSNATTVKIISQFNIEKPS
jgi:hypothetical protein